RDTDYVGFGIPVMINLQSTPTRFDSGEVGLAVAGFTGPLQISPNYKVHDSLNLWDGRMNAKLSNPRGTAPRPSSNHAGTVNFVFCDGAARPLNASMSQAVYAMLLSWDGQRKGQPIVDESTYRN